MILNRGPKLCNFIEWRGYKVVYKRYASLYFCMCIDAEDNELEVLEIIHHYVEILDRYFGSVSQLVNMEHTSTSYHLISLIFFSGVWARFDFSLPQGNNTINYHDSAINSTLSFFFFFCWHFLLLFFKAYYILDELLIAGELQESSKKTVARIISAQVKLTF